MTTDSLNVVRGMKADSDKKPITGDTARTLGARNPADVQPGKNGFLALDQGMSVSPLPVSNLPKHRRPAEFGGTGKDDIFKLDTIHLATYDLKFIYDLHNPKHGFIAPFKGMTYNDYQIALHATKQHWVLLTNIGK